MTGVNQRQSFRRYCALALRRLLVSRSRNEAHPFGGKLNAMTDPHQPSTPGTISAEEFHRVQQSPEFSRLRRTFRSFAFPMTAVFLAWYFAYVLASIFAKDLMMTKVAGNMTVGLLFGIAQFASTFLITGLYIWYSTKKVDPIAEKLRDELEASAR